MNVKWVKTLNWQTLNGGSIVYVVTQNGEYTSIKYCSVISFYVLDNCKNKINPHDSSGSWGTSEQFQASGRRDMSEHSRCATCHNEYALYTVQ